MPSPEKVLIPLDEYRFETVGRFRDGRQFMAFVTGAFPGGEHYSIPKNWRDVKRWIAVLHIFDANGNHLTTDARRIEIGRDVPIPAGNMDIVLPELLADFNMDVVFDQLLTEYEINDELLDDIWIKLFHVVIDDIHYEFVYEVEEEAGTLHEQAILWPNDIVFYPPWNDGNYDT